MEYQALYEACLLQMESDAAKCRESGKRIVLGYASDLDVLLKWDQRVFSRIVADFLTEEPRCAPGDRVDSMEAFARIVTHFLAHGLGGEIDITDRSVCDALEERFKTAYVLGGTCAQGAAALGAVGIPVLACVTDRSREVCALLDKPGIEIFSNGRAAPAARSVSGEPPVRHIVLQYPKGAQVAHRGKLYKAPVSNRLIMDYDAVHKYLPIEDGFLAHCEESARSIWAYGVSGFNAILDPAVMAERLDRLIPHYAAVKERNPAAVIYLEGAYFLNPDVRDLAYERLARSVDILGMNEEELAQHAARLGLAFDHENLPSLTLGLKRLLAHHPAQGIVLHTGHYAMYFGRKLPGIDFAKGLAIGNLMAATRARTGRYGTRDECRETLNQPLSKTGLEMALALKTIETGDYFAAMVPTRYMEHPSCTIGLGDTFTAGMLTAFIR